MKKHLFTVICPYTLMQQKDYIQIINRVTINWQNFHKVAQTTQRQQMQRNLMNILIQW